MSEYNPFSAAHDEVELSAEQAQAEEQGGSRTKVIAVGALAAALLGAGAFYFLSSSGGDEELEAFTPKSRAPQVAASAAPAPATAVKLPAKSALQLGRNPFRALYIQPPPPPPPVKETVTSVPAGTSQGEGLPLIPSTGSAPTGVTTGTGAAPQKPTAKEHKLLLLRVFGSGKDQSASFSIDGKQQTAKVGTTFGPSAEILLLSLQQGPKDDQWTAVLQVGDGDPFDVVTGEPVFVR